MTDFANQQAFIEKCLACKNLNVGHRPARHPKLGELKDGATDGCTGCDILLQAIDLLHEEDLTSDTYMDIELREPGRRLTVKPLYQNTPPVEIFRLPGTEVAWFPADSAPLVSGNTYSGNHLDLALTWLQDCLSNHSSCGALGSSADEEPLLPKRVIDVTALDDAGSVRLVQPTNQRAQYMCLSHCWGKQSTPMKTTSDTLHERLKIIPWHSLPKVFQDAVNYVRLLGQRYIWVDSLCIIQDDTKDWEEQAIHMASIYQNSYLTLAATKAKGSEEGLHSAENAYPTTTLSTQAPDGEHRSVLCRDYLQHIYYFDSPDLIPRWNRHSALLARHFPLLDRAWGFQERLLSPRILHFGPGELLWECCESFTCECTHGVEHPKRPYPKIEYTRSLLNTSPMDRSDVWRNVIESYSKLSITYDSDRIPAILGIAAQLLGADPSTKLISGMWTESLLKDLLWQSHMIPKRDCTLSWRAPSWSWVGMKEGISYSLGAKETIEHATVVDLQLQDHQTEGRFIRHAKSLKLSALMLPGRIKNQNGRGNWFIFDEPKRLAENGPLDTWFRPDWSNSPEEEGSVKIGSAACLLFMATLRFEKQVREFGLVIRLVDAERMEFERIGCVTRYHYPDNPLRPPPGESATLKEIFEGVERSTITLI